MGKKETGDFGEKLARDFLNGQGYEVIETNYRCPEGEVDIVCRHEDSLVFVEVRTRTSLDFGSPGESVTRAKKSHLIKTSQHYLQNHYNLPSCWRIDFVGVMLGKNGEPPQIELIQNAITG